MREFLFQEAEVIINLRFVPRTVQLVMKPVPRIDFYSLFNTQNSILNPLLVEVYICDFLKYFSLTSSW